MIRIRTAAVSAVAIVAAMGGLSACTSSGTGGGATVSAPVATRPIGPLTPAPASTGSTDPTTQAASTSSSGGGSSSSSGAGSSRCAESQLRANATADDIKGLARHVVRLAFTNKSGSSCTLTGFPGAAIENSSNEQVQQAERVVGGPVGGTIERSATLTLRAGATAYAYLEGTSTREQGAAQAGCDGPKYPRILVTPPNTTTPVPFAIGWPQCYSFDVHPVRTDS